MSKYVVSSMRNTGDHNVQLSMIDEQSVVELFVKGGEVVHLDYDEMVAWLSKTLPARFQSVLDSL